MTKKKNITDEERKIIAFQKTVDFHLESIKTLLSECNLTLVARHIKKNEIVVIYSDENVYKEENDAIVFDGTKMALELALKRIAASKGKK